MWKANPMLTRRMALFPFIFLILKYTRTSDFIIIFYHLNGYLQIKITSDHFEEDVLNF